MRRSLRRQSFLAFVLLLVSNSLARPQEPPELDRTLDELARAIKQAGYQRVGVAPSFITAEKEADARPVVSSPHGLYFADLVQAGLVARQGNNFTVIDADVLAASLRNEGIDSIQNLDKLQELAGRIGGLDAIIVGKLELSRDFGPNFEPANELRLECKLLELSSGNLKAIHRENRGLTLADEIYAGSGIEVLRRTTRGLLPIGLSGEFAMNPNTLIPLNPHARSVHFEFEDPLSNPSCPYRVYIKVDEKVRKFVHHPNLEHAYIPLEPGETFSVTVENKSTRTVNVAVFVDGLNILGKRRELPDEKCKYWVLRNGTRGEFRGFYDNQKPAAKMAPFQVVPVEDSVAMQQKFTDHLGLITIVFFDSGWPTQSEIIRRRYQKYMVNRFWNNDRQQWEYQEEWAQIAGAPQGVPRFAIGAGEERPANLRYVASPPGPILAAMTIRYATQSEINRLIELPQRESGFPPELRAIAP